MTEAGETNDSLEDIREELGKVVTDQSARLSRSTRFGHRQYLRQDWEPGDDDEGNTCLNGIGTKSGRLRVKDI